MKIFFLNYIVQRSATKLVSSMKNISYEERLKFLSNYYKDTVD
jgi:hypothetical protein